VGESPERVVGIVDHLAVRVGVAERAAEAQVMRGLGDQAEAVLDPGCVRAQPVVVLVAQRIALAVEVRGTHHAL